MLPQILPDHHQPLLTLEIQHQTANELSNQDRNYPSVVLSKRPEPRAPLLFLQLPD